MVRNVNDSPLQLILKQHSRFVEQEKDLALIFRVVISVKWQLHFHATSLLVDEVLVDEVDVHSEGDKESSVSS